MGRSNWKILIGVLALSALIMAGCKRSKPATEVQATGKGETPSTEPRGVVTDASARRDSAKNLQQIGVAMHNFHGDNGTLPSVGLKPGSKVATIPLRGVHGWRVQLLPYLEQAPLFATIDLANPVIPASVKSTSVATYRSPLANKASTQTPYRVFVGNGAIFDYGAPTRFEQITDGLANTILAVEAGEMVDWADGPDLLFDPNKPLPPLGIMSGGFNALLADGSVRWIDTSKVDEKTIKAMITRAGGEVVELP
jgi:hypothetical protein